MLLLVLAVAITAGCRSLPRDWTEREPSQDALIGLQRFFRQAQREVLALNPYLVPGEPFFSEAQLLELQGNGKRDQCKRAAIYPGYLYRRYDRPSQATGSMALCL